MGLVFGLGRVLEEANILPKKASSPKNSKPYTLYSSSLQTQHIILQASEYLWSLVEDPLMAFLFCMSSKLTPRAP
jgi:hypothetical protein